MIEGMGGKEGERFETGLQGQALEERSNGEVPVRKKARLGGFTQNILHKKTGEKGPQKKGSKEPTARTHHAYSKRTTPPSRHQAIDSQKKETAREDGHKNLLIRKGSEKKGNRRRREKQERRQRRS